MKVKMHRAHGASSWQNPDAQKPLVGYLGSLTLKISPVMQIPTTKKAHFICSCGHIAEYFGVSQNNFEECLSWSGFSCRE